MHWTRESRAQALSTEVTGLSAMFMGKAVCFYSEFLLGLTRNEYRKNVEETWRNARDMTATNLRHVTQTKLKLQ